jgi:hypothetical protein
VARPTIRGFVAGFEQIPVLAQRWQVDMLWVDKQGRHGATAGWQPVV